MEILLTIIHGVSLIFALVIAPLFCLFTFLLKKKYKDVEFEWKRAELNIFTVICFSLNLGFFIAACFFFAGYLKRIHLDIIHISPHSMGLLCLDSLLMFFGITTFYLGLQNIFVQRVYSYGVVTDPVKLFYHPKNKNLIYWHEIKDYYIHSDYPLSQFHFILLNPEGNYIRKSVWVPFYALTQFETILEINLQKHKEEKELDRKVNRNYLNKN